MNYQRISTFWSYSPVLLGIHRNSNWKEFLKSRESFLRKSQFTKLRYLNPGFRYLILENWDFLKKDSQNFKNSFQFGFLWIPSKTGEQNQKVLILWWFIIVERQCVLLEKIVLVVKKKILEFKVEGREFAKCMISLEQFIQTVKCQNNFW